MSKFKIVHDRPGCIACGACAALNPKDWEMAEEDGLSTLLNSDKVGVEEHKDISVEEYEDNRECADACPVNVIHIEDTESNTRLI